MKELSANASAAKKFLALLMCALIVFSFAGCADTTPDVN